MEKQTLSLSERISVVRKVRKSLKGKKGQIAFIVVADGNDVKAFMHGKMANICRIIDYAFDKSEDMEKVFKIVNLKRIFDKVAPDMLKKILEEKSKEEPSETPEPDKVNTEENPQQNEHAE